MPTPDRLLPWTLVLLLAGAGRAAFERSLFPTGPGAAPGLTVNPAQLAGANRSACGQVGHERPFGLDGLSGHHLLLAAPVFGPLRLGVGLGQRGPEAWRERGVWLAAATVPTRGLAVGVAAQGLTAGGPGAAASGWAALGGLVLSRGTWGAGGWFGPGHRLAPARGGLHLEHRSSDGHIYAALDLRGHRRARVELGVVARPTPAVALHLGTSDRPRRLVVGIAVRRGGWFAAHEVGSHPHLGATPSWSAGIPCR